MTDIPHGGHQDSCLMCAVRALTEGDPAVTWNPDTPGQSVSGVVLRKGELSSNLLIPVPFVDLWTGGTGRIRVNEFGRSLRQAIDGAAPQIGDRLQVWYDGEKMLTNSKTLSSMPYKMFRANVQRGH